MQTFRVYVETGQEALDEGGPLAHVPALPGCTARAKSLEQIPDAIRQAIRAYLAFLRANGESTPPDEFDIELEEVAGYTLPPDYAPLAPDELAQTLRWLQASRQAVLSELAKLPPEAWDWKPGDDAWPLRTLVGHLSNAELYLTDKLLEPERAPFDRLEASRGMALERLAAISPGNEDRVTTFDGEDWTPRKVLRRMLEHEQEHLAQIRDIISRCPHKGTDEIPNTK
jgi:predicted RNase H-like HicB family nuclease